MLEELKQLEQSFLTAITSISDETALKELQDEYLGKK